MTTVPRKSRSGTTSPGRSGFRLTSFLSLSDLRVARHSFWFATIAGVNACGTVAQVMIATRMLGTEGFGQLVLIIAMCALVHGLVAMPGGEAVMTFVARSNARGDRADAGAVLRFTMAASFALSLVGYAVIVALASLAGPPIGLGNVHLLAILLLGLEGVLRATQSESVAVLRLSDRVYLGLAVALPATAVRLALLGLAWSSNTGLLGVATAYLCGSAVHGVAMFAAAIASTRKAGISRVFGTLRVPTDVLRFQAGIFGKSSVGILSAHIDVLLLGQLAGTSEAGLYKGARYVVEATLQPFRLIQLGLRPELSMAWFRDGRPAVARILRRYTWVAVAIASSIFVPLALLGDTVVPLVLGDTFTTAAEPLVIMALGAFVVGSAVGVVSLPIAVGRVAPSLGASAAGLATMVVGTLILAPPFGAAGGGAAYLAACVVSTLFLVASVPRLLRRGVEAPE